VRERAIRLVDEQSDGEGTQWAVIKSLTSKIGYSADALRGWVRQAEWDRGQQPGLIISERVRHKEVELENRELKKANEILCLASRKRPMHQMGLQGIVRDK
jgi:transposase